ncbi:riboflavin biosynthesis protein RibD [Chelatococcus reniformis]|uniref:Riboflavin biosynthesis protein RibD n=2 Tax=Chelatococcus reniformis TaxID=1494448 RepID=A0A916UIK8_9HYPH|nr:bifunctional diaminohydroxyphosphoribosylaminopyrimidine deaminase/5-amino-6-(5-phosphoribosylamino)uracil reductase RibD [Chelatococcus reniformis]GGC74040.1 riboflavin biosynthesis protein RibD [Chelatococcus reniformis]
MRQALALGHRHLGRTWPNPSVGAVLVRPTANGPVVVGRGATQPGGRPHAEVVARAQAGAAARGATLYVTLEPCSHVGRTGPCADAMIEAGVARVVSAIEDPNPLVAGHGHARLAAAGVDVVVGVEAAAARQAHLGHFTRVREGRPAVTLKLARTLDGFAARVGGSRLMITEGAANARVHLMRAHADGILVGLGTVLADDPALNVRLPGMAESSPIRIVFDSQLNIPLAARLVATARDVPTWVVAAESAPAAREAMLVAAGVEVLRVAPAGAAGRLDPAAALRLLATRGLTRLLCEGGPALADALAEDDLIDEVVIVTGGVRLEVAGLAAVGPSLARALAGMRALPPLRAGPDRFAFYERQP